MSELTEKQQEILEFIKKVSYTRGYPPSVREIGSALGINSTSTVHAQLNKIETSGFIRRDPTKPRAIEILDDTRKWLNENVKVIPIIGTVKSGVPILTEEHIDGYYPMITSESSNEQAYVLRVKDNSMINAGILSNDCIIVEEKKHIENGEIIAALIGEEVTVKRFFSEKGTIRLQPENDQMESVVYDDIELLGKVVGVFRDM
ncbi:MAG: transcriptional repressor LexA [Cellulosilyticaceae bacterium]